MSVHLRRHRRFLALSRAMRRPATYWVVAAALAVITAVGVNQLTAEARRLRAAYGATVDVTVVVEATGVGLQRDAAERGITLTTRVPDDASWADVMTRSRL